MGTLLNIGLILWILTMTVMTVSQVMDLANHTRYSEKHDHDMDD